jgi:hypothetical protein
MRHLLLAALTALFTATAAPAFAASMVDFSYTGTVSSDVTVSRFGPFPIVFGQNLTGKPVQISEIFNLGNADLRTGATYVGLLGNNNFASAEITIGNVSAPLRGNAGDFTPTVGGFSSGISLKGSGVNLFTILDFSSTFDFTQNRLVADGSLKFTNASATRNLDFNITSETLALPPVLSPVPLPPALPLFAFALLALGIAGYVRRAKGVTAVQT